MAKIVLGIATSHTPMLNTPAKDWPSFIDRDGVREFLDKEGDPATYEELLTRADPRALPELTPERFAARHDEAMAAVERLKQSVRRAELDALIIIGDDQKELFHEDHLPSILVYYGDTIRNVPLSQLQGTGMVAAGHRALLRGEGAARLSGRLIAGAAPDR